MILDRPYFLCGVGGSGMLSLALILRGRGATVAGSDRALDQGRTGAKFDYLRKQGIALFAQDGSGVTGANQIVVISAAVEDTVPDVVAARRLGATLMTRAELLSQMFNAASENIGVAGTSGKSTVTGMIGWILHNAHRSPTIMNGAVMNNFEQPDAPFASAVVGENPDGIFVSEVDESDGSIARYTPHIAVVTNISPDHKPMEELRVLFAGFAAKARKVVLNLDNPETAALAAKLPRDKVVTYSMKDEKADVFGTLPEQQGDKVTFVVSDMKTRHCGVTINMLGVHNASNALAAIAAAEAAGVSRDDAVHALHDFQGIKRRMDRLGTAAGVTVYDDFAHNPDKIATALYAFNEFSGRLIVMFQPHGFGPLKAMKDGFIDAFRRRLGSNGVLLMPEPVYYGGTTDKSVSSRDVTAAVQRDAHAFATRAECGDWIVANAKHGDHVVVMGARDDTLTEFAQELLDRLARRG